MRTQATRRWLVGSIAALATAGVALRELPHLLRRRYHRTQYDDLLSKLVDRDSSVTFGRALNEGPGSTAAIAALLRQRLRSNDLRSVAARELSQGEVLVVGGWVVPESLALICALAARMP
jgi:hypothetical protein